MRPIGNAKAKPTSQIMTMMTFDISLEGVRRRGYIMARYLEQCQKILRSCVRVKGDPDLTLDTLIC